MQKSAIPIWLLIALFGWATFHLLFLSQNPVLQYEEFTSIWKRSAIGVIFAFGMGISIARICLIEPCPKGWLKSFWVIFYIGISLPTLIYLVKIALRVYGQQLGIHAPAFMSIYIGPNSAYVAKTAYVAFCIPLLALAFGALWLNIKNHRWLVLGNCFYLLTIPAVFIVFLSENIKNGIIYGVILAAIFIALLFVRSLKGRWIIKLTIALLILLASFWLVAKHVQENPSWKTFSADAKIALDTTQYPHWKYSGTRGYPVNELGVSVSVTNYDRIAWAKEGIKLLRDNPWGYGLVERSFGHLAKIQWPDSQLHQSHSGWLDLALGIGIPGVLLVFGSFLTIFLQLKLGAALISAKNSRFEFWVNTCSWALGSSFLMWCTTEISQKVYFDEILFWLALGAGISLVGSNFIVRRDQ